MFSFIEIPQIGFNGADVPSLYVNVADIITFKSTYDNGTEFEIRDLGTDNMAVIRRTYMSIGLFLEAFSHLADYPGVRSWSDETKATYGEPAKARARAAADRERAVSLKGPR